MVCGRCGNNNPQGGRYCENCGNDLWAVGTTKKQKGQQNQQNSKTKLIVLIVAVIVAIAAVVGSVILISQSGEKSGGSSSGDGIEKLDSYEEVFDNYAKAYETGDIKYILKAFPEQAQELFKKNEEYIVEIIDNGYQGEGIAKIDGMTIFVDNVLKGEKVKIKILKVLKTQVYGKVI